MRERKKRGRLAGGIAALAAAALLTGAMGCGRTASDRGIAVEEEIAGEATERGIGEEQREGSRAGKTEQETKSGAAMAGTGELVWENGFVYLNGNNQLYLWQQGAGEPVLLADSFMRITPEMMGGYDDETIWNSDINIWNMTRFSPDKEAIYYPAQLGLRLFGDNQFTAEYDLYCYDRSGERSLVAEKIVDHQIDRKGNMWYARVEEEEADAAMDLYRFDGQEHVRVGEMGRPGKGGFQAGTDGSYVVFRGEDGGLYGAAPGKEAEKLAEHAAGAFYLSEDMKRCIGHGAAGMFAADLTGEQETGLVEMEGEGKIYLLDENGENVLLEETEEVTYPEILENDWEEEEIADQLWEQMKGVPAESIKKCRLKLYQALSGQVSLLAEGYLLGSIDYEEMEVADNFFYLEMIPQEELRKIPVSEYFGPDTAEDLAESYEYLEADVFRAYGNPELLYRQAKAYLAGGTGLLPLEQVALDGQWEVRKTYNKADGNLYVRVIRSLELPEGYDMDVLTGGEDVYEIDAAGNCRKVAESAGQTLAIGDQVYYTRAKGSEGAQRLYCLEEEGYLLEEPEGVNLDQMRKSVATGEIFYLSGSYGIGDNRPGTLNRFDGVESREMAEQIYEFLLYGDDCVAALQNTVDTDSDAYAYMVTMGDGNSYGRLLVFEDGQEKVLEELAIGLMRIR